MEKRGDLWFIRAVQGHTIGEVKDDELLTKITNDINDPENVFKYNEIVHGTYE